MSGDRRWRPAPLLVGAALAAAGAVGAAGAAGAADLSEAARQVEQAERAFARSMAERNFIAFRGWLAADAVFFGSREVQRGRDAVAATWRPFFDGAVAPFSWQPDQLEVLADASLALTSGPVRNPQGKLIGRFNSIWRQESPGVWRVVFDKGSPPSAAELLAEPPLPP